MSQVLKSGPSNALLASLTAESFSRLEPHLEPISLPIRSKFAEAGKVPTWMTFPDAGMVSIVATVGERTQEIGIFGREGAGCTAALVQGRRSTFGAFVQIAGSGNRILAVTLRGEVNRSLELRNCLSTYLLGFNDQVARSSLANAQFTIERRLARWLLMIQDRVGGDVLYVTHEFLAQMLGVARTGMTLSLEALQKAGHICMARGRITIMDREALMAMTSLIYGKAEMRAAG